MPNISVGFYNPWKKKALLWVSVLGVCLFHPFFLSFAFGIEANSSLFDQNPSGAVANTASNQPMALPEEIPNPSPSIFSTLIKVVLALALIVALIYITIWGLKLIMEKRGWNSNIDDGKPIKVLTSTFLAPRKSLYLVEVGKRILVLGVGQEEISCLDIITEQDEVDLLKQGTQQGFPKIFNHIMQKQDTAQTEVDAKKIIEESNLVVGGYLDKLKKISTRKKTETENKGDLK
jgi:flagellar biogenesis protein FliO